MGRLVSAFDGEDYFHTSQISPKKIVDHMFEPWLLHDKLGSLCQKNA
jgi:hypothetical protein